MLFNALNTTSIQCIDNYDLNKANEGFVHCYIDNANKSDIQPESKSNKGLIKGTASAIIRFIKQLDYNTTESAAYDTLYDFVDEIEIALRKIKVDTYTHSGTDNYIVDIAAIYETDVQLGYISEQNKCIIGAMFNINIDFYQNNLFQ